MLAEQPTESLILKTKQIMQQLLKAQGIEIEEIPQGKAWVNTLIQKSTDEDHSNSSSSNESSDGLGSNTTSLFLNSKKSGSLVAPDPIPYGYALLTKAPSDQQEFFICGGICLNFSFIREPDNPLLRIGRYVSHSEFYPKEGILILYMNPSPPPLRNVEPVVQRALSVGNYRYKQVAEGLVAYQQKIPEMLSLRERFARQMNTQQLRDNYDLMYKQFEDWAMSKVHEVDANQNIFGFSVVKFNLNTLEYEFQISGQSKGLMAVRGYDIQNPDSHFFRQCFHYLDGEANMQILLDQLQSMPRQCNIVKSKAHLLTFDGLRIESEFKCCSFTNRDQSYPNRHLSEQGKFPLRFEYFYSIVFWDIPADTLMQLIQIRNSRGGFDQAEFEDFSYSMETQIFLERFYKNQIAEKQLNDIEIEEDYEHRQS